MPRTKRLHQLKRPNIRQDWSKWNLYNLSRVGNPQIRDRTFFQQKWTAKSMLRAYHNPDVREGTWTKMFDRRLPAVVPMDHRYLARYDGSELAEGRGMGVEKLAENAGYERKRAAERTPYMHMTFHPLERRLDTAIFRALFASSTRQARQFVTHGWVKVNGKKMKYPSYQLNPGDMFSVDPERVMFATGARKDPVEKEEKDEETDNAEAEKAVDEPSAAAEGETTAEGETSEGTSVKSEIVEPVQSEPVEPSAETKGEARKELRALMERTRSILEDARDQLSGKRQRELRDLSKSVKKLLSQYRGVPESQLDETIEGMQANLAEILGKVPAGALITPTSAATTAGSNAPSNPQTKADKADNYKIQKDAKLLAAALERVRENPYDPSKPYATPWKPRDYMSAFAFIPRYLEVNQNICSAVYVRHPVARPGLAEVPTPYSAETMALGFNWYLRRR